GGQWFVVPLSLPNPTDDLESGVFEAQVASLFFQKITSRVLSTLGRGIKVSIGPLLLNLLPFSKGLDQGKVTALTRDSAVSCRTSCYYDKEYFNELDKCITQGSSSHARSRLSLKVQMGLSCVQQAYETTRSSYSCCIGSSVQEQNGGVHASLFSAQWNHCAIYSSASFSDRFSNSNHCQPPHLRSGGSGRGVNHETPPHGRDPCKSGDGIHLPRRFVQQSEAGETPESSSARFPPQSARDLDQPALLKSFPFLPRFSTSMPRSPPYWMEFLIIPSTCLTCLQTQDQIHIGANVPQNMDPRNGI
ncbi:hypothetical protein QTP86_022454, partial [Hemibagrus guttatus]